jgi:putative ABC transport system permease protein
MYRDGAFIDVADGTDPHGVADDAERLYEGANLTCTSVILQDRLDALENDPSYASLVGFLYMEYVLSVAIMTIGVGLLIFVSVNDRERELASIMARGSSGGQVRKILMGESISLMALGLVVGAGVGILTAYLFNTLSGEDIYTVVERRLVFTYVSLSIVLSSVVALLVAALIATSRAGKIKLAEVLRVRGG